MGRSERTRRAPGRGRAATDRRRTLDVFGLSPRRSTRLLEIDGSPVWVIDDLYADPHAVREAALSLDYTRGRGFYPGPEAQIWIPGHPLCRMLGAMLSRGKGQRLLVIPQVHGLPRALPRSHHLRAVRPPNLIPELAPFDPRDVVTFSAFTDPRGFKIQPHYDDTSDEVLAAVVYLNLPDQCRGGTAFFRHRETGIVRVPDSLSDPRLVRRGIRSFAELAKRITFLSRSRHDPDRHWQPTWEIDRLIEMRFNRLVLYPGNLLHGLFVEPGSFGPDLASTRLTMNLFLSLEAALPPLRLLPRRRARSRRAGATHDPAT